MAYYLGIDGGGTRTTAVLGDEHSMLAEAAAGGSNVTRLGEERAREALHQVIREVCAKAGILPSQVQRVVAGVAGASREHVSERVRAILAAITPAEVEIAGDMVITHQAALGGEPGVIVLSGTGSIAYGRNEHGQTARAGGWGFAVSDEGSGHWIGLAAVKTTLRAYDAGEDARLLRAIFQRWQVSSVDELVRVVNAQPAPDFSLLFPDVLELASSGDKHSRSLLINAGEELAKLGLVVLRRLFPARRAVKIAVAGGVFRNSPLVCDVVASEIASDWPGAAVEQTTASPALGALALARRVHSLEGK